MNKPPRKRNKATSAASTDSTSAANSVNEDISQQVDPSSATITVTAVEVTELTQEEQSDIAYIWRGKWSGRFLRQVRHWQNCAIVGFTVQVTARLRIIVAIALGIVVASLIF
ncbi:hypothetical protein LC613_35795 [Nostoc sphaeroides CHAB 2801]|uniref:hypothetical protein n=1 Tax=Nostoc sphaeroides TaxID=446679 RepID=UPI001E4E0676|nr:hypothetical protein [Nostoc sphaeroides]MCC5632904.1 hypothetical protein [Nostoc sphaeroides CHAB 2801]